MSVKSNDTVERSMVNFREFPADPMFFNEALKPYVNDIINKHGIEEWKAVVLTNEFHHHMGLWSLVGAKMGIRAREILKAPFDEVEVVSSAGMKPPFSCLNDGLQVSTGASLGRGTIKVINAGQPFVDFTYLGKTLTMKVSGAVVKEIGKIIKDYSEKYIFQSPRYFQELDKISIVCWLKWERSGIFDEMMTFKSQ